MAHFLDQGQELWALLAHEGLAKVVTEAADVGAQAVVRISFGVTVDRLRVLLLVHET
jgi:hypothetical protein